MYSDQILLNLTFEIALTKLYGKVYGRVQERTQQSFHREHIKCEHIKCNAAQGLQSLCFVMVINRLM